MLLKKHTAQKKKEKRDKIKRDQNKNDFLLQIFNIITITRESGKVDEYR